MTSAELVGAISAFKAIWAVLGPGPLLQPKQAFENICHLKGSWFDHTYDDEAWLHEGSPLTGKPEDCLWVSTGVNYDRCGLYGASSDGSNTTASESCPGSCRPTDRLDVIEASEDCAKAFRQRFAALERWTFLGDSTMMRFARTNIERVSGRLGHKTKETTDRCERLSYIGLAPPKTASWKVPDRARMEGPLVFGLSHHHCTDCSGCGSFDCARGTEHNKDLEYIAVEFARDVTLQRDANETSQEQVGAYLEARRMAMGGIEEEKTGCLFNSGFHDMMFSEEFRRDETFVANVRDYVTQLRRGCDIVVWLSIAATMSLSVQNNTLAQRWNRRIENMLRTDRALAAADVFVLDTYNISDSPDHHADNVHMTDYYYHTVGGFLFSG